MAWNRHIKVPEINQMKVSKSSLLDSQSANFLVDNLACWKWNSMHQITSSKQGCPDVAFINRSKEYRRAKGCFILILDMSCVHSLLKTLSITVTCRTAIKVLFVYFNLCKVVLSCSFTSISFLTNTDKQ